MNFSARKHAEKIPQIPQHFQQVSAAGTCRFWTLGWATLNLRVAAGVCNKISECGSWDRGLNLNQLASTKPGAIHVGFTPDAAFNLLLQCLATLTGNGIKALGLLRQALFFSKSGTVIHLPCHPHCPIQSAMACADAMPAAIRQLVSHLPHSAVAALIQHNFAVTHVVSGFFSSCNVQALE